MSATSESSTVKRVRWSSEDAVRTLSVENPATGKEIAVVHCASPETVDRAVTAAHTAFQSDWRWRPIRERVMLLRKAAAVIREHTVELAELETQEVGKPLLQSRDGDLMMCAASFDYFAGAIDKFAGEFYDQGPVTSTIVHEPYGVIAGIIPFNWPPVHFASKAAPALAMGNTVVMKPPEQAPLTIIRLVELLENVLPRDVLHVVPGAGDIGAALASHPLVRRVTFTGSSTTGVRVLKGAADNLTPTVLELGGKNPIIIFDDADIDQALQAIIEAAFFNNGEACSSVERVLVQRGVINEVERRLQAAVRKLRVGDPMDPEVHLGPLIDARQRDQVVDYLRIAEEEGATIAAQAPLPELPKLKDGYFFPPTLLKGLARGMRVAREEIFGPVTGTMVFDTYDEAIAIANETPYGLMASVFTADQARAMRATRELEAGIVFVNNYWRAMLGTPFGGVKASGHGREHALETLRDFSQTKNIRIPSGRGAPTYWSGVADVLG